MAYQVTKISENCWKHEDTYDTIYTVSPDPASLLHREDGPAFQTSAGYKAWWINGKRHRLDGPAIEQEDCHKLWYYHDKLIDVNSQEEFEIYLKNIIFI